MKRQRWDDRLATRAVALTRIAAAECDDDKQPVAAPDENATARAVIAMYLTPVGAYISVSADGVDEETGQPLRVSASCEACGWLQYGERHAQDHVQTCRRLPERLWPENAGGAQ